MKIVYFSDFCFAITNRQSKVLYDMIINIYQYNNQIIGKRRAHQMSMYIISGYDFNIRIKEYQDKKESLQFHGVNKTNIALLYFNIHNKYITDNELVSFVGLYSIRRGN